MEVRANDSTFMTKELRKEIMFRSRLRNRLKRERTISSNLAYKKQRNKCSSLLRKNKNKSYGNLDHALISHNKKFWRTVKPLFSDKAATSNNIILLNPGKYYIVKSLFSDKVATSDNIILLNPFSQIRSRQRKILYC